ncbi:MAG TPA: copper resistance protein CopC [Acidimicrobiales bacterium]|nr:copper resistance protein CopC [Acidimicrobiales bacterium]
MTSGTGRRGPVTTAATTATAALIAALVVVLTPARADAHAELLSTEPAAGERLDTAPTQVVLHFSEAVGIDEDLVRVLDGSGEDVEGGSPRHVPGEQSSVALELPPLEDGAYVVAYRVISSDSHPVGGAFTFHVGEPEAGSAAGDQALIDDVLAGTARGGDPALGVTFGIARFAAFAGIAVLVGALAFLAWLWPAGRDDRRARSIVAVAWWVTLVATALCIPLQAAYTLGGTLADAFDPSVVGDELSVQTGRSWLSRLVVLVVLAVVVRARRPNPWVVSGLGLALLVTVSLTGHAVSGRLVALAFTVDVVHLAAASVWLGGLTLLVGALLWRGRGADPDGMDTIDAVVRAFSTVAFAAVAVIVATGTVQSWRQLGGWDALWGTDYGGLLTAKVVLFGGMLVAAAFSRTWVLRRAAARTRALALSPGPGAVAASPESGPARLGVLRRSVGAEAVLAVGVLVVTAALVNAVPGESAVEAERAPGGPFSAELHGERVMVTVEVDRAEVGDSDVRFRVTDHGLAPLTPEELRADLSLPDKDLGPVTLAVEPGAGPGQYVVRGTPIPFPGDWELEVVVRTSDIDQDVLRVTVPVA